MLSVNTPPPPANPDVSSRFQSAADRGGSEASGAMDSGEDRSSEGGGAVMERFGAIRSSVKMSFRRAVEKSPLSPKGKESKVTPLRGVAATDASSPTPPPKDAEGLVSGREEDGEATPQKKKGLTRSMTSKGVASRRGFASRFVRSSKTMSRLRPLQVPTPSGTP